MSTTPRNDLLKRLDALQVESRLAFYHSDANTLSEAVAEILYLRAGLDAMCALEELRQARDENAELRKDKARLDWLDSCGDVCSDLTGKYNWKEWLVSTINSSIKLDASIRSAIDSEMKLTKEENEN